MGVSKIFFCHTTHFHAARPGSSLYCWQVPLYTAPASTAAPPTKKLFPFSLSVTPSKKCKL